MVTIPTVPDFIAREQYLAMFAAMGLDPSQTIELRAARDGVHALVFALDENGERIIETPSTGAPAYQKHRIFIPVRDYAEVGPTTRIRPVTPNGADL